MDIVSASDELVITDVGMTYLAYTFSEDFGRYAGLENKLHRLQELSEGIETVPTIYDVQRQEEGAEQFISITAQKPELPPLNEGTINNFSIANCKQLILTVIDTLAYARQHSVYHLDIGFHTISYDAGLEEVCIMDWYDSVLSTPAEPPFYISEYYPPILSDGKREYSESELQRAENYQLCCFIDDLLQVNEYPTPNVIHLGRVRGEERPTIQTIRQSIEKLE